MPAARFLRHYWQRRPLLVRRAFADFELPLDADDLAGLACEPVASARLVLHDRTADGWKLETGPFDESRFRELPERDWTLLVQDCDKLLGEVDTLLESFRFLPEWRVDDVMVSYAAPGGSVGPHVDLYDVFLLQGQGRRTWRIDTRRDTSREFRQDVELKILTDFDADHEWVLGPGDMLYLPSGVPHHGVAIDDCLTFSIGMRAPAWSELVTDAAEFVAARASESSRLADAAPDAPGDPARISPATLAEVRRVLRAATQLTDVELAEWFGGFITRYRAAHEIAPAVDVPDLPEVRDRIVQGTALHRHPWSRYAWQTRGRGAARLHFAGDGFDATVRLARLLESRKRFLHADLATLDGADWRCVGKLIAAGHLVLGDAPSTGSH